jgi:glucose-1-phosphate thymidylyltransferase
VTELGENGWVKRLIEKPQEMENNLAVVGFYYFKDAADLLSAIDVQIERNTQLKGEFFLADAVSIMLERAAHAHPEGGGGWTPALRRRCWRSIVTLCWNTDGQQRRDPPRPGVVINPPVFIHPTAQVQARSLDLTSPWGRAAVSSTHHS